MMYDDKEGKKRFIPNVPLLLIDQDTSKILSMLKSEKLTDLVDSDGTTLLHLSAKHHNKLIVDYLISQKVDVNAVNSSGETPLMSAIQNHTYIKVWKALLDAGADLWTIKNNRNQSALTIFIRKYRSYNIFDVLMNEVEKRCRDTSEVAGVLLNSGFKPHHLDIFKKAEITKLMLQRGCLVNLQDFEDEDHNAALHVAAKVNDLNNVKVLLEFGADKHLKNFGNELPIVMAFYNTNNPNRELLKLLLPDDKEWVRKDDNMYQILLKCSKETLEFLMQQCGVDLNARDADGRNALFHLMTNRDLSIWEFLKNVKVDVKAVDKNGTSLLHEAIRQKNAVAVRFLLDAGVNVNALNVEGQPPLFYFSYGIPFETEKNVECVELLMKHGADAQLIDQSGRTVFSHITIHRAYYLLDIIVPHLTISEALGTTLKQIILNEIGDRCSTSELFEKCKHELDEMKAKTISGVVTYFKFLTDEDERISKYVKNEEVVKELSKCESTSYFYGLLKERFNRAMKIESWRKIASQLISECIEPLDGHWLIIENILDLLDETDLKLIATSDDRLK